MSIRFPASTSPASSVHPRQLDPQAPSSEAVESFRTTLEGIFGVDILDGGTAHIESHELTPEQSAELEDATKELLLSLPANVFSEHIRGPLLEGARKLGVRSEDMGSMSLNDIEDAVSNRAEDSAQNRADGWVDAIKEGGPIAYVDLFKDVAVAVGLIAAAVAIETRKAGKSSYAKLNLFDDKVQVKTRAVWDAGGENVRYDSMVTGTKALGDNATFGFKYQHLDNVESLKLSTYSWEDTSETTVELDFDRQGFSSANMEQTFYLSDSDSWGWAATADREGASDVSAWRETSFKSPTSGADYFLSTSAWGSRDYGVGAEAMLERKTKKSAFRLSASASRDLEGENNYAVRMTFAMPLK